MNRAETVKVMSYLNRAGLLPIREGQDEVWAQALADLDPEQAVEATVRLVRERESSYPPVVPGEVRKAARRAHTHQRGEIEQRRIINEWRH